MRDVRAGLLAGGRGERMGRLTEAVCKPMVPYAGSCRLVDFSLANAVRSGIPELVLMSRHLERDLIDHLLRRWDGRGGMHTHLGPYEAMVDRSQRDRGLPLDLMLPDRAPEQGTADALLANAEWLFAPGARDLLILHADHVYHFDYQPMLAQHRATGADVTVGVQRIERRFVHLFGMVEVDDGGKVRSLVEKPAEPTSDLVFTAFCLFRADVLQRVLTAFQQLPPDQWRHDISRDVLPLLIRDGFSVRAFPVTGYWADIGTVQRYLLGHLELIRQGSLPLDEVPRTLPGACPELSRPDGVISSEPLPPGARVRASVLYPGCVLEPGASVERSVVLPGARVAARTPVRDTIVLPGEQLSEGRSGLAALG